MFKADRRDFLKLAAVCSFSQVAGPDVCQAEPENPPEPVKKPQERLKTGIASYTFLKFDLEKTLKMTQQVGISNISLKDMHFPLDSNAQQTEAIVAAVKAAKINFYTIGVVYMRSVEEVDKAFKLGSAIGLKTIVGVPNVDLLGQVEKNVKQYDIKLAIHNHGPRDEVYPVPEAVYEKIKNLDSRIGLCIDIGHTQRANVSPAPEIIKYADRLYDLHIKDVTEKTVKGTTVEMGRGVIDMTAVVKALYKIKYPGICSFEYEKDADKPLVGIAESLGYFNGIMDAVRLQG
ncbi:MAG: sugar phosphate isomerase/epimerase [Phycisphaerae bacterium]|nr:sugar phosphate isomerase/epimerase [Phycisphaerae bacterium]